MDININLDREIAVRNSYIILKLKVSRVVDVFRQIKSRTGGRNLETAIELMLFEEPSLKELEDVGMLTTLIRCMKDGNIEPPVDFFRLYKEIPCRGKEVKS